MSAREQDLLQTIEYPESDGEPMAETGLHVDMIINLRFALTRQFRRDPNVYIGSNMLMYWVKGDPTKSKAPDVFIVFGVPKTPPRRTWKVWDEGKAPDVVIEVSSRKTWREDMYEKWQLYAKLGVREYYLFDPEYDYLPEPFMAWQLEDGQYIPIRVNDGCAKSEALGLEFVHLGQALRLRNPQTGELIPTEEEEMTRAEQESARAEQESARAEQELARAEQESARAEQEAARAERAEAEIERLRTELAKLKKKPAAKSRK